MPFMKPDTVKGCYQVENKYGESSVYPADLGSPILGQRSDYADFTGVVMRAEYYPDKWIGRYSAPGYLDATIWSGPYDSQEECLSDINDLYGDENA
jgi:hypothetical protein